MQILEIRGLEVYLVNAKHVKNVPGRRTDVSDCQWLQYLHSVGLLRASFRPVQDICAVQSLLRHRASLVDMATGHVQHMQKALDQITYNVTMSSAISPEQQGWRFSTRVWTGIETYMRWPRSGIHAFEPVTRPSRRVWWAINRREHMFRLGQSVALYREYQRQIVACEEDAGIDEKPRNQSRSNRNPADRQGFGKEMQSDVARQSHGTTRRSLPDSWRGSDDDSGHQRPACTVRTRRVGRRRLKIP